MSEGSFKRGYDDRGRDVPRNRCPFRPVRAHGLVGQILASCEAENWRDGWDARDRECALNSRLPDDDGPYALPEDIEDDGTQDFSEEDVVT